MVFVWLNRLHNDSSKHNRHAMVLSLQIHFEIQPAEGTTGIDSYRSCCFLCSASSCNRRSIFSCFFPPFRERDDTLRANSLCLSSLSLCITQKQDIFRTGRKQSTSGSQTRHVSPILIQKGSPLRGQELTEVPACERGHKS